MSNVDPSALFITELRTACADLWNALLSHPRARSAALARVAVMVENDEIATATLRSFERVLEAEAAEAIEETASVERWRRCRRDLATLVMGQPGAMDLAVQIHQRVEADEIARGGATIELRRCQAAFHLVCVYRQLLCQVVTTDLDRVELLMPPLDLVAGHLAEALSRSHPGLGAKLGELELEFALADALGIQPAHEASVLRRSLGLSTSKAMVIDNLDGRYCLSHERICQLRARGLCRLRADIQMARSSP